MKPAFVLLLLFLCGPRHAMCQHYDTASVFSQPVLLDSFVISNGFDVNAFIARVKADTTFYKAFKSMRLVPYTALNDIAVAGKDGAIVASLQSRTNQVINKRGCRSTQVLEQHTSGDFYKRNGSYNYYTAKLFAHLFFADTPVCNQSDIVAGSLDVHGDGQMEKSEYQLKQLIFNPGAKVNGIPFMGARASIFDPGEAEKYDFKITRQLFEGVECFRFSVTPKAGYEHDVIYTSLITWFRQSDYSIIARDYSLSYHTMVYDFDVAMKVRTTQTGQKLYPTSIAYDGNWHIFTQKRERVKFTIAVTY